MAWVRFLADTRRRVQRVKGGITTSVIDYKAGMVENVPHLYADAMISEGKAEAVEAPNRETAHATPAPSGSSDGATVATRSRRRRSR